jgi:hypothetical protein
MSSLSRELVFLILQFLDEEKFKETVHKSVPSPSLSSCRWSVGYFYFFFPVGWWLVGWASKAPRDFLRCAMIFFFLRFSRNESLGLFLLPQLVGVLALGFEFVLRKKNYLNFFYLCLISPYVR